MLEEFAASLASGQFNARASFERLVSPPVAPQLHDEDPSVAATLDNGDPAAVDSCALRTPPPLCAPFSGRRLPDGSCPSASVVACTRHITTNGGRCGADGG
jgi:hypothetical protein